MKKYLLSLIFALAASAAWAQGPVPANGIRPIPEGAMVSAAVPGSMTATATTTSAAATAAHPAACDPGCVKMKTVCIAQPATVTKTKVLFSSDCETLCHKTCFGFLKKADCDACPLGNCGHAYRVKSLYKRVETQTCDSYKCVPVQVPVCATPACPTTCANGNCVSTTTVAVGQSAPAAPPRQIIPASMRPTLGFAEIAR